MIYTLCSDPEDELLETWIVCIDQMGAVSMRMMNSSTCVYSLKHIIRISAEMQRHEDLLLLPCKLETHFAEVRSVSPQ
jgi:hypothetical protein